MLKPSACGAGDRIMQKRQVAGGLGSIVSCSPHGSSLALPRVLEVRLLGQRPWPGLRVDRFGLLGLFGLAGSWPWRAPWAPWALVLELFGLWASLEAFGFPVLLGPEGVRGVRGVGDSGPSGSPGPEGPETFRKRQKEPFLTAPVSCSHRRPSGSHSHCHESFQHLLACQLPGPT